MITCIKKTLLLVIGSIVLFSCEKQNQYIGKQDPIFDKTQLGIFDSGSHKIIVPANYDVFGVVEVRVDGTVLSQDNGLLEVVEIEHDTYMLQARGTWFDFVIDRNNRDEIIINLQNNGSGSKRSLEIYVMSRNRQDVLTLTQN